MVVTKKSPLSILIHLRVVNLACLKQRFDDCSSFILPVQFIYYLQYILTKFMHIAVFIHFTIVARSILKDIKKQLNTIN